MASKTLGPFPKTLRWREIAARAGVGPDAVDSSLRAAIDHLQALAQDEQAQRSTTFLAALPVCSRFPAPASAMRRLYGIEGAGPELPRLRSALRGYVRDHLSAGPAEEALAAWLLTQDVPRLFPAEPWAAWRKADGAPFCDLARLYFAPLAASCLSRALPSAPRPLVDRFAWEASLIVRAFSARWFKACALDAPPHQGSINWYLGHCLGKLELELTREVDGWVEPACNPWRRGRKLEPALGL